MTTKKKRLPKPITTPEPGWMDFRTGQRPAIFTAEFVEALTKKFKIDPARVPELQSLLEQWADIYRVWKFDTEGRPRPPAIKAELERIRARIDALRESLEGMHRDTETAFWRPESGPEVDFPPFSEEHVVHSPYGHTIQKVPTGDKSWVIFRLEQSHHFESLTILRNYADAAIARLRPDRGGRVRGHGLRMWAVNIINYWQNSLHRRFTLKCYRGHPITDGSLFCVEAFKPIDPRVPTARLVTAMRQAMKTTVKTKVARTPSK